MLALAKDPAHLMRRRLFEFECPWCGSKFSSVRDTYLLTGNSRDPDYQHIIDGTFFTHQCQSCRRLFTLSHPLLYRDRAGRFAVCLTAQKHVESDGEWTIVTRNTEDFLFCVQVLDKGLDLKEMIRLRRQAEKQGGRIRFLDYDQNRSIVWFLRDHVPFGFAYHLNNCSSSRKVK